MLVICKKKKKTTPKQRMEVFNVTHTFAQKLIQLMVDTS